MLKRGCVVAWRETAFALSVFFNEILHSPTCIYCKAFLTVSVKCTAERGVALLTISNKRKKLRESHTADPVCTSV